MEFLGQMLRRNSPLLGDRPFVRDGEDVLSYAALLDRAEDRARLLAGRGVVSGTPVGLFLPNGLDYVESFWACQLLGAIAVPMSPMLRPPEIVNIVSQTKLRLMIVDDETGSTMRSIDSFGAGAPDLLAATAPTECGGEPLPPLDLKPHDIATLFFTSGTTGIAKGAMQSHFAQYSALRDMMVFNRWRFGEEVVYCALPLTNNMACTCMMNLCMFAGGTLIIDRRWDTRRALDAIKQHRVTFMVGPPTISRFMVSEFIGGEDDLSSLKLFVSGGAPVPPDVLTAFETLSGGRVIQAYGATEVCCYVAAEPLMGERRTGSAGFPVGSARIAILDDNRRPVPTGEPGEIFISGDTVGAGYWGDAETTAASFVDGGWLSGDIGRIDEEGFLYIIDRKKDLIISGGFNIYPIEVERELYTHPAVKLCAVIGLPDADRGESPTAVILTEAGQPVPSETDVIGFCRERMSAFKVPRQVIFVDEMPLSPVGKILKRELRDRIVRNQAAAEQPR